MTASGPLIAPAELAARLADPTRPPPVLLDVRWTLAGADPGAHLAGHLPGALFVDLDAELAAPPGDPAGPDGRHPLPAADDLQRLWAALGLSADTDVVVYDGNQSSVAARAWWLLRWSGHDRVRVLDGGFAGWVAAGGQVQAGPVDRPGGGTLRATPGGLPTVDAAGAAAAAGGAPGGTGTATGTVLDARAVARYRGEVEPIDPVAGHIPGAVSLPLTDLLDDAGRFLDRDALRARFTAAGVGAATSPVVASCGSGVTACHLVLAGELAGIDVTLFPASWSGWCAAGRPVAVGAAPGG